ncbi:MAG: hypothetical protein Hyperionvirus7_80 [Hyperionvirus sp.]|uniref:Uncharacterized protein n=1 Tax=Hyperionvirus sp. TaxID=2487770 RepID=A0A3G5ADR3_9VIRU|nr:MAG: hypothetical protein Hyperionvirus7_80 [Hyperionvirus sp.]
MINRKILILYALHEITENFLFFCRKGYIENDNYHFIFIINNLNLHINFLRAKNVQVINRENKGYDFAGWTHALFLQDGETKKYLYENYDYFIFMNSTLKGPFLPLWFSKKENMEWPDLFIDKITDDVKLVGTTINLYNAYEKKYSPHVQSMLLATDKIGLKIGIDKGIFDLNNIITDKIQLINKKEIGFSKVILTAGYNIQSMLFAYDGIDFRKDFKFDKRHNDHCYTRQYFNISINPYEVIFIKATRNIDPLVVQRYTEWQTKSPKLAEPKKRGIDKLLYGITESESVDITKKILSYLEMNRIIRTTAKINNIIGFDPNTKQANKIFIYYTNIETPEILNEFRMNISSNIIMLGD